MSTERPATSGDPGEPGAAASEDTPSRRPNRDDPAPPPGCRTLQEYVLALLGRLRSDEPAVARRVREVVGHARARIVLDDEAVEVAWGPGGLTVDPVEDGEDDDLARAAIDGVGAADRATTLELLAGRLEVHEAVLAGRLRVRGSIDDVARMVHAIELLLDASARIPALQDLARDYREDPCREPPPGPRPPPSAPPIAWFPRVLSDGEARLLDELGLLPTSDEPRATPARPRPRRW